MRIKVLCVDDEPSMLELAKLFLEEGGGISVDPARSSEEALRLLRERRHDAVVCDYLMPGETGLDLLRKVRAEFGDIPFILLTGKGREDVAIGALNSGADFYIQKGSDLKPQFTELANMIKRIVEGRRAEQRFKETSDFLAAVVRSSPAAMVAVDTEGRVILWNPGAERIYGWTEEEVLGGKPPILPPGHEKEYSDIVKTVLAGKMPDGVELERVRKDGSLRTVLGYFARILDKEGTPKGALGSFVDITELKRMDEDLKRVNRLYDFLSHTNATIVRARTQTALLDDACLVAVEHGGFGMAWACLLDEDGMLVPTTSVGVGLERVQEMRGQVNASHTFTTPMDIAVREGRTVISSDLQADFGSEPWFATLNGLGVRSIASMPLRRGGKVVGTLTTCAFEPYFFTKEERLLMEEVSTDISFALEMLEVEKARRRAEARLKRESEFTKAVLDTAGAVIVVLDTGGRIVRFNKEAEEVTGMTADEVHGRTVWECFVPEPARPVAEGAFVRMLSEGAARDHENVWVTKDGVHRTLEWNNTVLRDGAGAIRYVIGTGVDVTERKKAQEDLKRRTEEALAARNRAQTYLDFMTHDIMNIITPLNSYSELIFNGEGDDRHEFAARMVEQTRRLSRFVTHVRKVAYSEMDAEKGLEAEDLKLTLPELDGEVRRKHGEKEVVLSYELPDGPVIVHGKGYVGEVIAEVLDNAVRHSGGSKATVEVAVKRATGESGTAYWQVEVADHGPGIPDEQKVLLLSKSFSEEGCTTRGVATTIPFMNLIIERLGGTAAIEDRVPGDRAKGTRVVLRLPALS